ncbi:phage baseplate assembly protein V [Pseudomonas leptonychotis]|uniref:Phage baseplate assembly protein V n=1 Tax=Pseudomonas leptonychotis TaxID=2448482 RepID=A0A4T2A4P9_9PSED|nr:phage baseplate assembly protein V [Pseudomonas leptonychotis]TIH11239.1 phage baseplate assembly protein V [Pseudomonas leptonychotis]
MNELAELARKLENLIRFGTVAQVQMQPPRVRVQTGTLLTTWLPWINPRAGLDREWNPPTEGEQVVLFSPSGTLAQGVALTGLFSDLIPANGDRAGLHRSTYRDGAVIEYDSIAKHLRATLPGSAELNAVGPVTVITDASLSATAQGDITLTSAANITITAAGNVAISGAKVDLN